MVFTFPADFASSDPNFTTLFRLLDDFDTYSREVSGSQEGESSHPRHYPSRIQHGSSGGGGRWGRNRRGVNPRFDIRETKDAYELYGELPGADREDIHIELTEPNTILIYGRVDRDYAPVQGGEEEGTEEEKKEEAGEKGKKEEGDKKEDKGKDKADGEGGNEAEGEKQKGGKKKSKDDSSVRFFLRERHVGEFAREFAFPGTLQEFDIEATLEKGILKVVAPKQQPANGRKIEIK